MPRYIDIDKMNGWTEVDHESCSRDSCGSCDYDCNECYYNNGGEEDVAPVVHSSWRTLCGYSKCNTCGQRSIKQSNYCPNCGAKMSE